MLITYWCKVQIRWSVLYSMFSLPRNIHWHHAYNWLQEGYLGLLLLWPQWLPDCSPSGALCQCQLCFAFIDQGCCFDGVIWVMGVLQLSHHCLRITSSFMQFGSTILPDTSTCTPGPQVSAWMASAWCWLTSRTKSPSMLWRRRPMSSLTASVRDGYYT